MYYDSISFKSMESGLAALNIKQKVHTHNIANMDTPDYKAKEYSFKNLLENEKAKDGKVKYSFQSNIYSDKNSILVDGNSVDIDKESLELYSTFVQSSAIIQKINAQFADYRYVLTQSNFK